MASACEAPNATGLGPHQGFAPTNPRSGFADLFATHPAVEARIEALARYAGGHAPALADAIPPGQGEAAPGYLGAPDGQIPAPSPAAGTGSFTSGPAIFVPPPSPRR